MLSPRDAFRVGFLERCAAAGLGPRQTLDVVKQAEAKLAGLVGDVAKPAGRLLGGVAGAVAGYGVPAALAAPPILGGLAGYGLARATDLDDVDIDDVKDNEIIDEYRRQADRLNRQQLVRRYQRLKRRPGRNYP